MKDLTPISCVRENRMHGLMRGDWASCPLLYPVFFDPRLFDPHLSDKPRLIYISSNSTFPVEH